MTMVCINLLGGLRIVVAGQVWPPLTSPRLASLLAAIVLHHAQPLDRDQLAAWLWPEVEDAETRRADLRRQLYLLRQTLPKEWLLTERDTVQWNPAIACQLDVDEFTRCAASHADDPVYAAETCLTLYQGDLLPELYDDWLQPRRQALRDLLIKTLQTASRAAADRGAADTALRLARRLLIVDPLLEETHRDIMQLCYQSGDRPAALQQYELCRAALCDELGVEPDASTTDLYHAILNGSAVSGAAQLPARPLVPPTPDAPVAHQPASHRRRWLWLAAPIGLALLAALVVILSGPPRSPLETLVIGGPPAVKDTWITQFYPDGWYAPDDPTRLPHADYMRTHLQFYEGKPYDRILIQFDLNLLPPDSRVEHAELNFHLQTWVELEVSGALTQSMPAAVSVFQMLVPWPITATFNQPWHQPGLQPEVDFKAAPLDTQFITDTAWLKFDVSSAVKAWVSDSTANHGLVLMIVEAPQGLAHYWVDMTDQGVPALRPQLRIDYRRGP